MLDSKGMGVRTNTDGGGEGPTCYFAYYDSIVCSLGVLLLFVPRRALHRIEKVDIQLTSPSICVHDDDRQEHPCEAVDIQN
jgi:hypothetical protein